MCDIGSMACRLTSGLPVSDCSSAKASSYCDLAGVVAVMGQGRRGRPLGAVVARRRRRRRGLRSSVARIRRFGRREVRTPPSSDAADALLSGAHLNA
jgi:hypothetical protein